MGKEMNKSYTCECGREHRFSGYVFAHLDMTLDHTCECGRKNVLCRGLVCRSIKPKNEGQRDKR